MAHLIAHLEVAGATPRFLLLAGYPLLAPAGALGAPHSCSLSALGSLPVCSWQLRSLSTCTSFPALSQWWPVTLTWGWKAVLFLMDRRLCVQCMLCTPLDQLIYASSMSLPFSYSSSLLCYRSFLRYSLSRKPVHQETLAKSVSTLFIFILGIYTRRY